jgi:hypothetical protein
MHDSVPNHFSFFLTLINHSSRICTALRHSAVDNCHSEADEGIDCLSEVEVAKDPQREGCGVTLALTVVKRCNANATILRYL